MTKKLPPEDIDLWIKHTKDVKRKAKTVRNVDTVTKPKKHVIEPHISKAILEKPFTSTPPQTLGRRELRRVQVDARLDLHGMTLDQAHMALERFLLLAQEKGNKIVL